MSLTSNYIRQGGKEYAQEILTRALGNHKALNVREDLGEQVEKDEDSESFFDFLEKVDLQHLLNFVKSEHPQTIALILSYLKPEKASFILSSLPEELQTDVTLRIINIGEISPEVLREIDRALRREFSQMMFVFEDILSIADKYVQRALREIDTKDLALALKGADSRLREKFFKNMSSRAAATMKEEMELMGPVRVKEVEAVQRKIANIFRELGEKGEIIIETGREEELIV